MDRKKMIERVKENESDVVKQQYKDMLWHSIYALCNEFSLRCDYTFCENSSDSWIEVSIYTYNLLWKNKWYNVIVDVDFETRFESIEEFVDKIIEIEEHWQIVYKHFNS